MHPKDELLRTYLDREMPANLSQKVQEHLSRCAACQARLNELADRTNRVQSHLTPLAPNDQEQAVSPKLAYRRFNQNQRNTQQKELIQTMFTRRPLWTALAVIALVAIIFSVTPASAWANSFLGLFRVQKVQVVTFDPDAVENAHGQLNENRDAIERIFKDDLKISEHGDVVKVDSAAEAKAKAGFTPRLPSALQDPELTVKPGMNAVFTIDQPKLQAIMDAAGVDAKLPAEVNGKEINVDVPDAVVVSSGCPADETTKKAYADCTSLVQMPSPSVDAPEGLDIPRLGEAMFQFLGLSEAEARNLSQRIDWTSTLVLPIPQGGEIQYQDVKVDGVTATLLQSEEDNMTMLIWVKDGRLYGLRIPGTSPDEALKIAESLN